MKIEITDEIYADALDFASSVATEVCKQNNIGLEKGCISVFDKVREAVLEKVIDVAENVVEHI